MSIGLKKFIYLAGIGFAIIILVAFVSSQLIYPILLGRPGEVEVPSVTGLNLSQAKKLLHEKRLHVVVRDSVWSEEAKVEYVLDQHPVAGEKLKQDHAVYLVISRGSREVKVPNILGMPYQQAFVQLRSNTLRTVIADSLYSDQYPINTIARVSPSVGTKVNKESSVRLFLSRGPEPIPEAEEDEDYYVFPPN